MGSRLQEVNNMNLGKRLVTGLSVIAAGGGLVVLGGGAVPVAAATVAPPAITVSASGYGADSTLQGGPNVQSGANVQGGPNLQQGGPDGSQTSASDTATSSAGA